jgi:hypothetical protein
MEVADVQGPKTLICRLHVPPFTKRGQDRRLTHAELGALASRTGLEPIWDRTLGELKCFLCERSRLPVYFLIEPFPGRC